MKQLFMAIKNKFDAHVFLKAKASGGLHLNVAPQNTDLPYIVFFLVTNNPKQTFNTQMENVRIQFSIFSDDASVLEACDIFGLLKNCFDDCTLTIMNYDHIRMRRDVANLMRDPDGDWHYQVDYEILIQEQ